MLGHAGITHNEEVDILAKEATKNAYNCIICKTTPRPTIYYQNANNEGMAKHLEANEAINTYQTLQSSSTVCAHKTVI
jgi:hypothetical protein